MTAWHMLGLNVRFYCTSTGPIGGLNCEVLPRVKSPWLRSSQYYLWFYCTSTGPIGGHNCEVLLYT